MKRQSGRPRLGGRKSPALVVFEDGGSGWGLVAASFFAKMTHPRLATAVASAPRDGARRAHVERLLHECGVSPGGAAAFPESEARRVIELSSRDIAPSTLGAEVWVLPVGEGMEADRRTRDALRERVWRLVAREGWYRLQPAFALVA